MKERDKTKEQRMAEQHVAKLQMSEIQHKRKERRIQEALTYAENIIETVRESLLVLDSDLRVVKANRSFYDSFKVTPEETIGNFIYGLGNGQWDIPALRSLLEDILPRDGKFDDYEVEHDFSIIGHKVMLLNARRITKNEIGSQTILLAIEDITERRRLESLLSESQGCFRHVFETANNGILLFEKREGRITHANHAVEKMSGYSLEESVGNKLQDIGIVCMDDFQTIMHKLDEAGIISYTDVPIETKSG